MQVVMVPTTEKRIKLKPGLIGSSKLSVTLTNGMISNVGQTTNPATAQMLTALTGTYTALKPTEGGWSSGALSKCSNPRLLRNKYGGWVPAEADLSEALQSL